MHNKLTGNLPKAIKKDWQNWHWQFKNRITRLDATGFFPDQPKASLEKLKKITAIYPLAITPYYFSLINQDDPADPIRIQSFPDSREIISSRKSKEDPLEEDSHMPVPKLVQR